MLFQLLTNKSIGMKSMRPSFEMSRYKAKSLAIVTYVSVQKYTE